jgi:hypothetical protein
MFLLQGRAECRCRSPRRRRRRRPRSRRHGRRGPRLLTPAGRDGRLDMGEGVRGAGG